MSSLLEDTHRMVGELRDQVEAYNIGDRPMSPPAALLKRLHNAEELEQRLALELVGPRPSVPATSQVEGLKHDAGKLRWSLLPESVETVVQVLGYGAKKYAAENWRKVLAEPGGEVRYFDAALRHLWAWRRGEWLDPESGLPHLAHAACCVLFLATPPAVTSVSPVPAPERDSAPLSDETLVALSTKAIITCFSLAPDWKGQQQLRCSLTLGHPGPECAAVNPTTRQVLKRWRRQ